MGDTEYVYTATPQLGPLYRVVCRVKKRKLLIFHNVRIKHHFHMISHACNKCFLIDTNSKISRTVGHRSGILAKQSKIYT